MTVDLGPASVTVRRDPALGETPSNDALAAWAAAALAAGCPDLGELRGEVSIRLVNEKEGKKLNARYRRNDRATNVLSFPADLPEAVRHEMEQESASRFLGDLAICAPVVSREAQEQGKPVEDHWAHLVVHGVLHLLGHDHVEADQANAMEAMEIAILREIGVPDPYAER